MSAEAINLQRNRIMKRQRHDAAINAAVKVSDQDARKKSKMVDEKWRDFSDVKATVEEKRKEYREVAAAESSDSCAAATGRWPWSTGLVDEQMSWALHCLPCWDVEYVSSAYNELYGDVAWDDDIWGIKGIHEVPNS